MQNKRFKQSEIEDNLVALKKFQFKEKDSCKPSRIKIKKYQTNGNLNFESTQQSEKTPVNPKKYKIQGIPPFQQNQLGNKKLCRSTINLNMKNNQRLDTYGKYKNQLKLDNMLQKDTARIQRQNIKIKLQNENLKLQVIFLKNQVQFLQRFKTNYEQAQLYIQLLEKKIQHYQSDIAYFKEVIQQLSKKNNESLILADLNPFESNIFSTVKSEFSFCQKIQQSKQVQNSFSINYCLVNQQTQKASKQSAKKKYRLLNQSAVSQESQQIFQGIKYDQQIVFGDQFFQDILF